MTSDDGAGRMKIVMRASKQRYPSLRQYRFRGSGKAASGPAWGRVLLVGLCLGSTIVAAGGGRLEASDRVLVPSVSEVWRTRLKKALHDIRDGRYEGGLEILQQALTDQGGVLYEVRNESLLREPLAAEIDDEILVPEKSPRAGFPRTPFSRGRSGFPVAPRRAMVSTSGNKPRRFLPLSAVARIIFHQLPAAVL